MDEHELLSLTKSNPSYALLDTTYYLLLATIGSDGVIVGYRIGRLNIRELLEKYRVSTKQKYYTIKIKTVDVDKETLLKMLNNNLYVINLSANDGIRLVVGNIRKYPMIGIKNSLLALQRSDLVSSSKASNSSVKNHLTLVTCIYTNLKLYIQYTGDGVLVIERGIGENRNYLDEDIGIGVVRLKRVIRPIIELDIQLLLSKRGDPNKDKGTSTTYPLKVTPITSTQTQSTDKSQQVQNKALTDSQAPVQNSDSKDTDKDKDRLLSSYVLGNNPLFPPEKIARIRSLNLNTAEFFTNQMKKILDKTKVRFNPKNDYWFTGEGKDTVYNPNIYDDVLIPPPLPLPNEDFSGYPDPVLITPEMIHKVILINYARSLGLVNLPHYDIDGNITEFTKSKAYWQMFKDPQAARIYHDIQQITSPVCLHHLPTLFKICSSYDIPNVVFRNSQLQTLPLRHIKHSDLLDKLVFDVRDSDKIHDISFPGPSDRILATPLKGNIITYNGHYFDLSNYSPYKFLSNPEYRDAQTILLEVKLKIFDSDLYRELLASYKPRIRQSLFYNDIPQSDRDANKELIRLYLLISNGHIFYAGVLNNYLEITGQLNDFETHYSLEFIRYLNKGDSFYEDLCELNLGGQVIPVRFDLWRRIIGNACTSSTLNIERRTKIPYLTKTFIDSREALSSQKETHYISLYGQIGKIIRYMVPDATKNQKSHYLDFRDFEVLDTYSYDGLGTLASQLNIKNDALLNFLNTLCLRIDTLPSDRVIELLELTPDKKLEQRQLLYNFYIRNLPKVGKANELLALTELLTRIQARKYSFKTDIASPAALKTYQDYEDTQFIRDSIQDSLEVLSSAIARLLVLRDIHDSAEVVPYTGKEIIPYSDYLITVKDKRTNILLEYLKSLYENHLNADGEISPSIAYVTCSKEKAEKIDLIDSSLVVVLRLDKYFRPYRLDDEQLKLITNTPFFKLVTFDKGKDIAENVLLNYSNQFGVKPKRRQLLSGDILDSYKLDSLIIGKSDERVRRSYILGVLYRYYESYKKEHSNAPLLSELWVLRTPQGNGKYSIKLVWIHFLGTLVSEEKDLLDKMSKLLFKLVLFNLSNLKLDNSVYLLQSNGDCNSTQSLKKGYYLAESESGIANPLLGIGYSSEMMVTGLVKVRDHNTYVTIPSSVSLHIDPITGAFHYAFIPDAKSDKLNRNLGQRRILTSPCIANMDAVYELLKLGSRKLGLMGSCHSSKMNRQYNGLTMLYDDIMNILKSLGILYLDNTENPYTEKQRGIMKVLEDQQHNLKITLQELASLTPPVLPNDDCTLLSNTNQNWMDLCNLVKSIYDDYLEQMQIQYGALMGPMGIMLFNLVRTQQYVLPDCSTALFRNDTLEYGRFATSMKNSDFSNYCMHMTRETFNKYVLLVINRAKIQLAYNYPGLVLLLLSDYLYEFHLYFSTNCTSNNVLDIYNRLPSKTIKQYTDNELMLIIHQLKINQNKF